MPSARIRVNSHLRPHETSPSPAIQDMIISGHTRHRLWPYKAHLRLRPVYAIPSIYCGNVDTTDKEQCEPRDENRTGLPSKNHPVQEPRRDFSRSYEITVCGRDCLRRPTTSQITKRPPSNNGCSKSHRTRVLDRAH